MSAPPNVVLVTIDCWRYDRCGFNGYRQPTTPTLDRLAADSVVFTDAYATGCVTAESFPGILAGQHSYDGSVNPVHADRQVQGIPADAETLAGYLRDEGYETVATVTNSHLVTGLNFDSGFETFRNVEVGTDGDPAPTTAEGDDRSERNGYLPELPFPGMGDLFGSLRGRLRSRQSASLTGNPYLLPFLLYRWYQHRDGGVSPPASAVLDEFTDRLDEAFDGDRPVFGWTHLMDLHAPLDPAQVAAGGLYDASATDVYRHDGARLTDVYSPGYSACYDSALRYVDDQLGRLVNHLKARGEWDRTVLVVTGDHGEALYDRGFYGHPAHYLFDELLHVPLVVRTPDDDANRVDAPVSLGWLHEIIAETVDRPRGTFPATSDVESHLEPAADADSGRVLVADSLDDRGHSVVVRDGEWKFWRVADELADSRYIQGDWRVPRSGTDWDWTTDGTAVEHLTDPVERNPRPGASAPDHLRTVADRVETSIDDRPRLSVELDESVEDRLKQLGYV